MSSPRTCGLLLAALVVALLYVGWQAPLAHPATYSTTAYGPPWVEPNGTGITATGIDLRGSPRIYGVAVDPRVIPLGSKLRAWPNPYRCRRCIFRAFDTGGAIKGNRLDFYHPSRTVQLAWGWRTVDAYRVRIVARAKMKSEARWSLPPR